MDVVCLNSVEDNLLLHGASIVTANGEDYINGGLFWDADFICDISIMWDICCHGIYKEEDPKCSYPNLWNKVINALSELDSIYESREEKNILRVNKQYFYNTFLNEYGGEIVSDYIDNFVSNELMNYSFDSEYINLEFKNDQVRMCLTKAGLVLELKTYMICMDLVADRNGDCLTGVTIDWDGEDDIANPNKYLLDENDPGSAIDTLNEIDVIASCGLMPYFISCKNGKFTSEELYKLYSVGEQFGKGYSRKIIVATNLNYSLGSAKNIILQRAMDMGIQIIEGVHIMDDKEFSEALKKAMELPKERSLTTV